jgi:hypothetical protein
MGKDGGEKGKVKAVVKKGLLLLLTARQARATRHVTESDEP